MHILNILLYLFKHLWSILVYSFPPLLMAGFIAQACSCSALFFQPPQSAFLLLSHFSPLFIYKCVVGGAFKRLPKETWFMLLLNLHAATQALGTEVACCFSGSFHSGAGWRWGRECHRRAGRGTLARSFDGEKGFPRGVKSPCPTSVRIQMS